MDGDGDADSDGSTNEDEDDIDEDLKDHCSGDLNGNGEDDEGDRSGTIASFGSVTGALVITTVAGTEFSAVVTADTELEFDDEREGAEGAEEVEPTTADLVPGALVAELELDLETGLLEEIELG